MSKIRKRYVYRLVGRIMVFLCCIFVCVFAPQEYAILEGLNFFEKLSPFHLLWLIWCVDMFLQLVPVKSSGDHTVGTIAMFDKVALGSQKLFANRFRPMLEKINYPALRSYVISTTKAAYKVYILWGALVAVIGILYFNGAIDKMWLFMIAVFFYVCDLICVLIWCPFRLIMKNKCCTTCRIFNWDHLMMFSPLIFAGGFYALSLVAMSFVVWLVWELCVMLYPERFWEMTNVALQCSECTDKLCTQYCQKLRR